LYSWKGSRVRDLDTSPERLTPLNKPALVHLTRATGDQIEQSGSHDEVSVLIQVAGQVHHSGQLLRTPPTVFDRLGRHLVLHVFIHAAQNGDVLKRSASLLAFSSSGLTASQTVLHPVPSWRRTPLTEACSRRICSITHRHARVVSVAVGAAIRSCRQVDERIGLPAMRATWRARLLLDERADRAHVKPL